MARKIKKEVRDWNPGLDEPVCRRCGALNPGSNDRCSNCGEDPTTLPELRTETQMVIQKMVEKGKVRFAEGSM